MLTQLKLQLNSDKVLKGFRLSLALCTPIILGWAFGHILTGVHISLGTLCVGLSDSPGRFSLKLKGLLLATAATTLTGLWISSLHYYTMVFTISVLAITFLASYVSLYGNRATVIGVGVLISMSLACGQVFHFQNAQVSPLIWSGLLAIGGFWYILVAMVLWQLSPYKTAQQAVANSFKQTAEFIRLKANLFETELTEDEVKKLQEQLINQHAVMQQAINEARNELLTRRSTLQGVTRMGKLLMLWHQRVVTISEATTATHHDYEQIKHFFQETEVLQLLKNLFIEISIELDALSEVVMFDKVQKPHKRITNKIKQIWEEINSVKQDKWKEIPLIEFVVVKNILRNMSNIVNEINFMIDLSQSTDLPKVNLPASQLMRFVEGNSYRISSLRSNFSPDSAYFRHAMRLTIAVALGLILTDLIEIDQAHWIILTIVVIMKPNFGVTKARSLQRVFGTLLGGILAIILIQFVHDERIIVVLLFLFALFTFTYISINYAIGVIFITPYALLLFNLKDVGNTAIAGIRILDTFIGGAIAFATNYIIPPVWQYEKIPQLMENVIKTSTQYFKEVMKGYSTNNFSEFHYKMARKDAGIAVTNLSLSFQAMLEEPSKKQLASPDIYSFVVLSHTLIGHIATLSVHRLRLGDKRSWQALIPIEEAIISILANTLQTLQHKQTQAIDEAAQEKYLDNLEAITTHIGSLRYDEIAEGKENTSVQSLHSDYAIVYEQIKFIYYLVKEFDTAAKKIDAVMEATAST